MWRIREGQTEAAMQVGDVVRSDVAVAVADIPALVTRVYDRLPTLAPFATLLPFGHVGDGNLHMNFAVPRRTPPAAKSALLEGLFEEVDRLGGSISAEHGVGRLKREAIAARKPAAALALMQDLKATLDPSGLLNPGVVLAPCKPSELPD
jgi:FAD/FMN-containing dehydrogenase